MLITPPSNSEKPLIDTVAVLGDRLKALETETDLEKKYRALDTLAYETAAEKNYAVSSVKNMNRGLKGFLYGALTTLIAGGAVSQGHPELGEAIINGTALTGAGGLITRAFADNAITTYAAQQRQKAAALETLGAQIQKLMDVIPDNLPVVAAIKYSNLFKQDLRLSQQIKNQSIASNAKEIGLKTGQGASIAAALGLGIYGISVFMTGGLAAIVPVIGCITGMTGLGYLANNYLAGKIKSFMQTRGDKTAALTAEQSQVKEEMDRIAKAYPQMARATISEQCAKIQKDLVTARGEKDIAIAISASRKYKKRSKKKEELWKGNPSSSKDSSRRRVISPSAQQLSAALF